jgi:AAA+ ATPase superfamily predicted ATPase
VLFDLNPKENLKDLYDRKEELKSLSESLEHDERLVIIYGLRRVGKTSLIHTFLNRKDFPYIFIDVKEIYFEHASVPISILHKAIIDEFARFITRLGLENELEKFEEVESDSLTNLLKNINQWCKNRNLHFIITLDEAQYLRFGGRVKFDGIIAWSIDNLANITYILTGSEVGMLKDFLKYDDVNAPLYGRFRNEIFLNRFKKGESVAFLSKGFEEYSIKVDKYELDEAVERINGIIGWLTYYGHYRSIRKLTHKDAIEMVFNEGSKIMAKELEQLIVRSRKRYTIILQAVAKDINRWSEIKAYVTIKAGKISDTILNSLLQDLTKFGIIEKEQETYKIIDPIILYTVKRLKP